MADANELAALYNGGSLGSYTPPYDFSASQWQVIGAHGFMQFGDQGGPVVVETVAPPTRFSFRWNHPRGEEPVTGNSMLVEFTLTPEGDERTRLRVSESGHELLAWPEAEKERYADEHRGGWAEYLDRLARILAKRQSG